MYLVTLVHLVYLVKSLNASTHQPINWQTDKPITENTPGGQQRTTGFFPKLEQVFLKFELFLVNP